MAGLPSASIEALPGSGQLWGQRLVPGTREEALGPAFARKYLVVARPLISGKFVGYFNTIAIRIAEVNTNRDPMIGHVLDRDIQLFEPLVSVLQIIQAVHHPGHVIQTHLSLLLRGLSLIHI